MGFNSKTKAAWAAVMLAAAGLLTACSEPQQAGAAQGAALQRLTLQFRDQILDIAKVEAHLKSAQSMTAQAASLREAAARFVLARGTVVTA